MENWLKTVEKKFKSGVPDCMKVMMDFDLKKEVSWLKDLLETVGSPVVFCHNDMQEGNILLLEDDMKNNNGEPKLYLIGKDSNKICLIHPPSI